MKTIALLSNASGYGGSEKSIELIVPLLAQKYYIDIFVENAEHYKMLSQIKQNNNIRVIRLRGGKTILNIGIDLWTLMKYLFLESPNYVWANTNKGAFFLALIPGWLLKKTKKVIYYIRDFQWKYITFIFSRAKTPRQFIFPSLAYKEYYGNYIPSKTTCRVIPDPVAIPTINGEPETEDYILAMGGISRLKGYDLLIQAYKNSTAKQNNIPLFIYGDIVDAKFYNELIANINESNLKDWIHLRSFVHDVDLIIHKALFVVNSTVPKFGGPEMLGRTILEAWAHEKPVVAFNAGGPKYIITAEQDGLLVETGDYSSMAKAFDRLFNSSLERHQMGLAGRKKVEEKYSLEHIVQELMWILVNE